MRPLCFIALSGFCLAQNGLALGTSRYVEATPKAGSFAMVKDRISATILLDPNEYAGVARAATNLQTDIQRVTGVTPRVSWLQEDAGTAAVIVGTLGKSRLIDQLIQAGKLDVHWIS